ncbi:unnamed protein product [Miscanthus lutarioriparius]|uniref:Uncharacterized protein n=1 Tax=Miscanthus lutarioriparius TaxID=422564 RepID=A0A811PXC5_9POAL|nr:unnamed protein product [Miscanthus lutarioriparius]
MAPIPCRRDKEIQSLKPDIQQITETPQGFDSSYSYYGILDDLLTFQCVDDKSLPSVYPSCALCDNQFSDTYLFTEQKNVNAYGEQAS